MHIDTTNEFGQRVARRLDEELIIWLTTVDGKGMPQPRPVWFTWDGETFLVYSQPDAFKIAHIAANPQVALNFDGNGMGGDIVVFTGEAWLDKEAPPLERFAPYVEKYRQRMADLHMTPEEFAVAYPVALRVRPLRLRGH